MHADRPDPRGNGARAVGPARHPTPRPANPSRPAAGRCRPWTGSPSSWAWRWRW
jgi:hypothetical protein